MGNVKASISKKSIGKILERETEKDCHIQDVLCKTLLYGCETKTKPTCIQKFFVKVLWNAENSYFFDNFDHLGNAHKQKKYIKEHFSSTHSHPKFNLHY